MKKIFPLSVFSIAVVFAFAACKHAKPTTVNSPMQMQKVQHEEAFTKTWATYTNKQLHITFDYPARWVQSREVNSTNSIGMSISIEVQFADTLDNSRFMLIYHPVPMGETLYQYATKQYNEGQGWYAQNKSEMLIAGKKALVATTKVTKDGKGNMLSIPLKSIVVVFLDKYDKGEFELQITMPYDGGVDDKDVQHVLSSIQFIP